MIGNIKSILRNRLSPRKSNKYLKWLKERYPGLDRDHILESVHGLKLSDYFISMKSHENHMNKHYKQQEDFESDLVEALEHLCDYVEYLEEK